jgi:NAD(P)-dependent dehydrogenase (short-subunit alcohol dehydrogenase family)
MGVFHETWSIVKLFLAGPLDVSTTFPPDLSFNGQTILITGASSGLGFEAAIIYVNFGAEKVIITARDSARGLKAKHEIEVRTGKKDVVEVRVLDMDTFSGVQTFVTELKKEVKEIDIVLLNAGIHTFGFNKLGRWEAMLEVNTLASVLLGLLMMPWMRAVKRPGQIQHLCFTGSGSHFEVDIAKGWPMKDVIEFWNQPENNTSGHNNYAVSKLLLQYAMQEMAKLAIEDEGK